MEDILIRDILNNCEKSFNYVEVRNDVRNLIKLKIRYNELLKRVSPLSEDESEELDIIHQIEVIVRKYSKSVLITNFC